MLGNSLGNKKSGRPAHTLALAKLPIPRWTREPGSRDPHDARCQRQRNAKASVGLKWEANATIRQTEGRGGGYSNEGDGGEKEEENK